VESGLNCGGHAFASDGFLLGPILEEFKTKKQELISGLHKIYSEALKSKKGIDCDQPQETLITAQGGIGTLKEDQFLMEHYELDGTGWATPFLLVPEATNVDEGTMKKLVDATEEDIFVSDISPLNVPFNNLRNSNSDLEKQRRVDAGRAGSACPKEHLVSDTEFTEKPICTASRQYQKLKLEQLEKLNLDEKTFKEKFSEVIVKACICNDLAASALINNHIERKGVGLFTAICPGPNLAYFSNIASLKEMIDHIYGRINLLNETYRPSMFIKELQMYVDYFKNEVKKRAEPTEKQIAYFNEFKQNLMDGIEYYCKLFPQMVEETQGYRQTALDEIQSFKEKIEAFLTEHKTIFSNPSSTISPTTP